MGEFKRTLKEKERLIPKIDSKFDRYTQLKELLEDVGFICGYVQKFKGTDIRNQTYIEEERIYFNEEKGVIVYIQSYRGIKVKTANMYYEIEYNLKDRIIDLKDLTKCSQLKVIGNKAIIFSSIKECTRYQLELLNSEKLKNVRRWSYSNSMLYLKNYMEVKKSTCSLEEINNRKINESDSKVKDIINNNHTN